MRARGLTACMCSCIPGQELLIRYLLINTSHIQQHRRLRHSIRSIQGAAAKVCWYHDAAHRPQATLLLLRSSSSSSTVEQPLLERADDDDDVRGLHSPPRIIGAIFRY